MPEGHDADELRGIILKNFDMSLGAGLSKLAGKVFRIGHLGSFNDLMLAGTLSGVEMGLRLAGVPHQSGGVTAALQSLAPIETPAHAEWVRGSLTESGGVPHISLVFREMWDTTALSL